MPDNTHSPGGVFLSYAREDTDAARRIAEAMRAFGVDAWFDQSELRGGDAWDAKIKRQIRECALFMPIVSAATQARGEGYFRREWKMAVERTHDMAASRTFIVPVVIDDTPEAGAEAPEEFMRVQWTRLEHGAPTPEFIAQIKRLLDHPRKPSLKPDLPRPPTLPPEFRQAARKAEDRGLVTEAGRAGRKSGIPGWIWAVAVVVLIAVGAGVMFLRQPEAPVAPPVATTPSLSPSTPPPSAATADKSIAVLPFTNMSEEKDANAFFADGMHEDILTNLAYIRDVRVVSRTSVMQYRNTTKPISEIARELKVAYVLEGSVRRAGNKVRVTGQLIRAATDEHLWAKSYDRDLTDIFSIQGELAQSIAGALQAVIAPETKALLDRRPTENPAAYDSYLKARQLLDVGGLTDEEVIIGLLEKAVALDPDFAAAWSMLAGRHAFAYFNRDKSAARLAQAKSAIDTAARLAPSDPRVIEAMGDYYYYGFRDYRRANEQYQQLARLRPNDSSVFASLCYIARREGRFPEAVAHLRRAVQLEPDSASFAGELTSTLRDCRKYDEALAVGREYLKRHPDNLFINALVAQIDYLRNGNADAMRGFARRTVSAEDQPRFLYLQLILARNQGDWAEAIRLDREQRYFDSDTDTPRWMQDVLAAATFGEAGDMAAARARAVEVMPVMKAELARQPLSPHLWASLSLGHALLGEKAEALRCGAKAREVLPESRDALQGPIISSLCASALAWAGEKDAALGEFERLLQVPYGVNAVFERGMNLGSWQPLRGDPRFKALLNDPKNNAPLF